jgi:hypothetical protein
MIRYLKLLWVESPRRRCRSPFRASSRGGDGPGSCGVQSGLGLQETKACVWTVESLAYEVGEEADPQAASASRFRQAAAAAASGVASICACTYM